MYGWKFHLSIYIYTHFGGIGGVDCNVPLLGLVVVIVVCMDGNFTYLYI